MYKIYLKFKKVSKLNLPYEEFLKTKVRLANVDGFEISLDDINPALKLHNKLMVRWLVNGGRRACFASFGLHKTVTQLETVRCILAKTGGRGLIICPLGVRQEFVRDSKKILGWETPPKFIRNISEAEDTGIYLTNYETVRDGKLDPRLFQVASLDEASILRGLGGSKTFREFMRLFTGDAGPLGNRRGVECVPYRFVATATPSPNEYIELLAYADFLGVMDVSQAKTRFFKRDSTQADKLRLHPHKEEEFWLWVASWALFVSKPSDLTGNLDDDQDYNMPEIDIRWHEIPADHSEAGIGWNNQFKMFKDDAIGLQGASKEKRESIDQRIAKMLEIREERPYDIPSSITLEDQVIDSFFTHTEKYHNLRQLKNGVDWTVVHSNSGSTSPVFWKTNIKGILYTNSNKEETLISVKKIIARADIYKPAHRLIWHDQDKERDAIKKAVPSVKILTGSQDEETKEKTILGFSDGEFQELAAKAVMAGSGCNFQYHCHWAIYLGIGFKFNDFIQSIHRILRFQQQHRVRIDLIYTEAERQIRKRLEEKWSNHNKQVQVMTDIIKKYGLSISAMAEVLTRKIGVERIEIKGNKYHIVNNDNVLESASMDENSVGLILTSIPFGNQYEYSPNYADFGHSENKKEFWTQMDYLTPNLLRCLQPGRLMCVHVKDRITPSGLTGRGYQTVDHLHIDAVLHYEKHGFGYMGMKTIVTDVVRENNQTYRLGWTEQCKDGSKMGVGMPEYLLIFRKDPTDTSNSYADFPVEKAKPLQRKKDGTTQKYRKEDYDLPIVPGSGYSRSRWQIDAHGFTRSSGDRLLDPKELAEMEHSAIFQNFKEHSLTSIYDFEQHVKIAEDLEVMGKLPSGFMLLQPQSWSDEVWTDITRMLTLNGTQWSMGKEMHICPMQFDIADRVISQMSNPGDIVYDPFGGLMTVPLRAILLGRYGIGHELNPQYFLDGAAHLKAAEHKINIPTLFDAITNEA